MSTGSGSNLTDPEAVKALLDKLSASQAWQDAVNSRRPEPAPTPASHRPSVASLLHQLEQSQSASGTDATPATEQPVQSSHLAVSEPSRLATRPIDSPTPDAHLSTCSSIRPPLDTSQYTFQQALPLLAELSDNDVVTSAILAMKNVQDHLERQLFQEYQAIHDKYRDKVHAAQTKATMIGASGLSQHEANMLNHGYADELRKFNHNRVLPAWDGLVERQQARLRELDIPGMATSSSRADQEKQHRIIHVLEGLLAK